jgi:hypothetical protein
MAGDVNDLRLSGGAFQMLNGNVFSGARRSPRLDLEDPVLLREHPQLTIGVLAK